MRNEEEESYLEDITITFRHSEVEDSPENSNQLTSDRIFEDENEHQTAINIGESFRRRKITRQEDYDFQDEICVNPGIESTNIEIEDVEEIETEGEQSENRIWSSMKSIVSCFYMQKINNRMRYSHRISNDRLPTSISASGDDENYFSRKSVHRRNGEVVRLLSANETIYQKFPDEVFGNHSSEMFFWPYLIPWQVMIMTILLINYEIITYNVFYDFRYMYKYIPIVNSFSQYMIFWVLQMIYTIDSMLTLVHRQWNEFQIKNTITPRNRCFVANDLAVLLPTFLCSYLLDKEKFWVHAVQILSLNRIFLYTRQMTSTLRISRFTILYLGFIFIWLFNIALSSISFGASCFPDAEVDEWVCGKGYFYKSYSNMKYMGKPTTEFELYALTKLHALFLLPPMCEAEYYEDGGPFIKWMYIIFLTAMLLYSYLFVVPLLCKRIFKNDYMWISFSMMRYKAINSLLEMKFADIPSSKVDKFFTYAWRKRRALLVEPVVDDVPPELWLSVHHDIFYPAFAHSQLFVSEDHCFLRGLASRMRSELLMEGDVIVRKKELVARMIYVVEGSVQILTTEDDTTPQMVLGAGTVIGETSLIASYVSKCYICCHSMTCEIHVLDKLDFIEISSIYRKKFHLAMRTVKQRYQNAKLLDRLSVMVKAKVKKSLRLEEQLVTSTDWLKFKMQVNDNNEASLNSEEYSFSGLENWYIHASHTLSYLGLLALPQTGFESVADPVLLKLTFPFIFQPNSRVHQFWNKVIFVAVLFLAIYLPYSFSFSCTYTPFMRFYPIIYLILNTLDILLQISTSVQTKRGMSISIPEILYHLLQKPLFVVDLISTLPLYILSYVALNETALLKPFFQLNQLLKLYRIDQYLEDKWTIQTEYQFYWRRLIKYVVYFAYLLYLTTCLIFGAICANDYKCLNKEVYITREGQEYDDAPIYQLIFLGFYKTSSYFFGTLSLSVMEDVTLHECLPFAVIRVVSYFMNIYLFCSLISIKAFSKEEQFKFNENVKSLLMMTKENSRRTFENFRYSSDFQVYKYAYFLRHEVFQPGMPSSLGLILKSNVFMKVIMEHPIFVEMPRDLVMRLANYFQLMTIPMNQIIIKQYHPPKCMYFIINGVLKAIEDGTVMKKRLKPGDGVGVLEVCFGLPYKRSIVCETDVEVLVLNRNIFKRYLSNNHQGTEAIKHMLLLYQKTINSENKDRADMHQNVMNFLREKSMIFVYSRAFQPSVLHFSITRNIPNMFRGIVKLVRANSTFHPHSEFVYKLEFFHAALAISAFIFYPLQPVLVNCYMPETQVINLVLIGLGALLIYLQSCIGYYDPATGILVTRRGKAVKHYLKHSMCLDIFAIIPFEFLPITERQNIQLLLTYNRLFQIYRFIRGMNYLERKYKNYQVILTFAHFIVLLFLLLNALSSLVLINSCAVGIDINTDDLDKFSSCLKCYEDTLIRSVADSVKWGGKALHISSSEAYMYSAYFAITTIMSNALQNLVAHNSTEVVLSCVGPIFGLFLFLLYTSVFVNTVLDINHAEYQFSMKVEKLLHFYKTLEIPEEITIMTKSYLSSIWNFNRSLNLIDILEPVNSTTKTDIMFHVFIENLLKNKLLFEHAPYIFFDKLFDNIKIRYYSHKCYIILSGDIINEVYLVTKGYVHIFDSQKNYVGTIGPGSIFGAVGPVTWSHQRFSFVATSFVEALVIPALDMHKKVLLHLPELKKFFTEDQRYDMLVDVTDKLSSDSTPHQNNSSFKHSFKSGPKRGKSMRAHSYLSFHSFHDFSTPRIIPGPNNTILKVWTEFFVFLCTFSSSLTIYCIAINDDSVTFYVLYYVIDFFKMCNIFFRQQKINPEAKSNLPIVKNRKLSILFDIFISFPVDSFFILVGADVFLINLLKINRLFALIYVRYHWIVTCKRSMRDILANKISKLIFAVVLLNLASFFLVAISSLLYIIWVDQENYIDDGDNVFKQTHFLKCMAFIVGLHLPYDISTATMFPKTKYMLAFNVIFKLLSPFIFAVFLGYVYVCVCRSRFCYPEFMRRSTTFLRFLQNQRVANRFLFKVKSTFENNWYKFKDSPIPELFSILPYHLQTAVKNHAFGEHINFNIVFYGCNSDFLRQIIGCLKVLWLQPGDKIVKIHSRNGCMFFVVDGIVVMNGSNGVTIEILEPWESFGMAQGIDPNVGHAFNYIAHSNCCIAYLNYKDWSHLGEFHPESMRLIRDRIDEINIKLEEQYGASRYY